MNNSIGMTELKGQQQLINYLFGLLLTQRVMFQIFLKIAVTILEN